VLVKVRNKKMFNSRTLLVGTLVGGNTLEKNIIKSVNVMDKEISTKMYLCIYFLDKTIK
jgi:hypothetical protein